MTSIGKIRVGAPTIVASTATVFEAVEAMSKNRTGACVIIDDGRLKGLFTERDVMNKVVSKQLDPAKVKVIEVATTKLITATAEMPEAQALRTMIEKHIRHLPIVDDKGVFVMLDAAAPTRLFSALPEGVELQRVSLVEAIEITAGHLTP